MSDSHFEQELSASLDALAQSAPVGPPADTVIERLKVRTRRRQRVTAVSAMALLLAFGYLLVTAYLPEPTSHPQLQIGKDGQSALNVNQHPVAPRMQPTDVFDTAALLGHVDAIPFERHLVLQVTSLDESETPAIHPAWNSELDLEQIDFAYLPTPSEGMFFVAVPDLPDRRPF